MLAAARGRKTRQKEKRISLVVAGAGAGELCLAALLVVLLVCEPDTSGNSFWHGGMK